MRLLTLFIVCLLLPSPGDAGACEKGHKGRGKGGHAARYHAPAGGGYGVQGGHGAYGSVQGAYTGYGQGPGTGHRAAKHRSFAGYPVYSGTPYPSYPVENWAGSAAGYAVPTFEGAPRNDWSGGRPFVAPPVRPAVYPSSPGPLPPPVTVYGVPAPRINPLHSRAAYVEAAYGSAVQAPYGAGAAQSYGANPGGGLTPYLMPQTVNPSYTRPAPAIYNVTAPSPPQSYSPSSVAQPAAGDLQIPGAGQAVPGPFGMTGFWIYSASLGRAVFVPAEQQSFGQLQGAASSQGAFSTGQFRPPGP